MSDKPPWHYNKIRGCRDRLGCPFPPRLLHSAILLSTAEELVALSNNISKLGKAITVPIGSVTAIKKFSFFDILPLHRFIQFQTPFTIRLCGSVLVFVEEDEQERHRPTH